MDVKTIVHNYLDNLHKGDMNKVVALFSKDGTVVSPVYGTKTAHDFYTQLSNDTKTSVVTFDGYFKEKKGTGQHCSLTMNGH